LTAVSCLVSLGVLLKVCRLREAERRTYDEQIEGFTERERQALSNKDRNLPFGDEDTPRGRHDGSPALTSPRARELPTNRGDLSRDVLRQGDLVELLTDVQCDSAVGVQPKRTTFIAPGAVGKVIRRGSAWECGLEGRGAWSVSKTLPRRSGEGAAPADGEPGHTSDPQ